MKHLKNYKIYESSSKDIQYILQEVNDILQELVDEKWIIDLEYTPKKWGNNIIINENISVVIKKNQNKLVNKYPKGSVFNFTEISEYAQRVIDYLQTKVKGILIYEVSLCEFCYYEFSCSHPEKGAWRGWMDSDLTDLDDKKLLAIDIKIYLNKL